MAFEKLAETHGVKIKSFLADNGRFAEVGFRDAVAIANQIISFFGVGAHHQNGIIERYIQDITDSDHTLLLHAKRYWPDVIRTILWPFALKAAEDRRNHLKLDENGLAPINNFSRTFAMIDIKSWHQWGCPVLVLDKRAQSGCIPKWEPKARVGVYLRHSPCHAGSVVLVLNPKTLHVSPQYHVVFDDNFATVPFMKNGEIPPHWTDLVKYNSESATDDTINLANTWAAGTSDCEVDQVDPNLALTRSLSGQCYYPTILRHYLNKNRHLREAK